MTYQEKLKDPRWQKKRLLIMQRDGFECVHCGVDNKTLNIHHLCYGKEPWDVPDQFLITLCEDCHKKAGDMVQSVKDGELAALNSLEQGVRISLTMGSWDRALFMFARILKTCEASKLFGPPTPKEAFELWWNIASPALPGDADKETWWFEFAYGYRKVKTPLQKSSLALAKAQAQQYDPPEGQRYVNPKIKLLVAVCYQLQKAAGDSDFFISIRDTARICQTKDLRTASNYLNGLVFDGILKEQKKGTAAGRKATRYRYCAGANTP